MQPLESKSIESRYKELFDSSKSPILYRDLFIAMALSRIDAMQIWLLRNRYPSEDPKYWSDEARAEFAQIEAIRDECLLKYMKMLSGQQPSQE